MFVTLALLRAATGFREQLAGTRESLLMTPTAPRRSSWVSFYDLIYMPSALP